LLRIKEKKKEEKREDLSRIENIQEWALFTINN
jgi:hypothetical protein